MITGFGEKKVNALIMSSTVRIQQNGVEQTLPPDQMLQQANDLKPFSLWFDLSGKDDITVGVFEANSDQSARFARLKLPGTRECFS